MTLTSLLDPCRITHLFGPAAPAVLEALLVEASTEGWVGVPWQGKAEPFPKLESQAPSIVVVPVLHGDYAYWSEGLLFAGKTLWDGGKDVLLGVSADDFVPTVWKYQSAVRVECHAPDQVTIVKDRLGRRQGCFYVRLPDGTWEQQVRDVTDPEVEELLQKPGSES